MVVALVAENSQKQTVTESDIFSCLKASIR